MQRCAQNGPTAQKRKLMETTMSSSARSNEHSRFARRIVALWRNWNNCAQPDYSTAGEGKRKAPELPTKSKAKSNAESKAERSVVAGKWPSAPVLLSPPPQEIKK